MTLEMLAILILAVISAVSLTLVFMRRPRAAIPVDAPPVEPMLVRLPDGREVPIDSEEAQAFLISKVAKSIHGIPERHPQLNMPPSAEEREEEERLESITQRACANCKYFDLEGGQEVFRQHPTFMKAAQVVPPSEYGRQAKYKDVRCTECTNEDGTPKDSTLGCFTCGGHRTVPVPDGRSPAHFPKRARWTQFGLCELGQNEPPVPGAPTNVVWSGHSGCEGKLFAIKLRRLA